MALQLVAIQQARRFIAVLSVQLVGPFGQFPDVARLGCDVYVVGGVVAGDCVGIDKGSSRIQRLDGKIEQPASVFAPDLCRQRLLAGRESEDELSTAAAGGAVAHEARLHEDYFVAALRQVEGRGAPRDAPADYRDVGTKLAHKFRPRIAVAGCTGGGVVGRSRGVREAQNKSSLCQLLPLSV